MYFICTIFVYEACPEDTILLILGTVGGCGWGFRGATEQ